MPSCGSRSENIAWLPSCGSRSENIAWLPAEFFQWTVVPTWARVPAWEKKPSKRSISMDGQDRSEAMNHSAGQEPWASGMAIRASTYEPTLMVGMLRCVESMEAVKRNGWTTPSTTSHGHGMGWPDASRTPFGRCSDWSIIRPSASHRYGFEPGFRAWSA
ncbi:hypothetical protein D3C71_1661800 [compost metagenome]